MCFVHIGTFSRGTSAEKVGLCCTVQHNSPVHMAQNLKYKRFTVNVPLHLAKAILQRIPEVGYQSESAYFIGLALYDLWCRRKHKLTLRVMQEPPVIRDKSIDRIASDYLAGLTGQLEPSFFERYIQEIIADAIAEQAAEEAKKAAEKSEKPANPPKTKAARKKTPAAAKKKPTPPKNSPKPKKP